MFSEKTLQIERLVELGSIVPAISSFIFSVSWGGCDQLCFVLALLPSGSLTLQQESWQLPNFNLQVIYHWIHWQRLRCHVRLLNCQMVPLPNGTFAKL